MKKVSVELNDKEMTVLKRFLSENEVIEVDHIDKDNYKEYIGKTIKVTGDVDLSNLGLTKLPILGLTKLPINFTEVGGYFNCSYNKLKTLEGAPTKVGGYFDCHHNKLKTLVGSPKEVGGGFYCRDNKLKTLKGAPKEVGDLIYFPCNLWQTQSHGKFSSHKFN